MFVFGRADLWPYAGKEKADAGGSSRELTGAKPVRISPGEIRTGFGCLEISDWLLGDVDVADFRTSRNLDCWRACRELVVFVVKQVVPVLPRDGKYRLSDQITRAARSTTANIAEGYGRFHYLDNAKFCCNARGSAYEVLDHLITAHAENMIPDEMLHKGELLVEQAVRLLNGYISYLQRASKGSSVHETAGEYTAPDSESPSFPIANLQLTNNQSQIPDN